MSDFLRARAHVCDDVYGLCVSFHFQKKRTTLTTISTTNNTITTTTGSFMSETPSPAVDSPPVRALSPDVSPSTAINVTVSDDSLAIVHSTLASAIEILDLTHNSHSTLASPIDSHNSHSTLASAIDSHNSHSTLASPIDSHNSHSTLASAIDSDNSHSTLASAIDSHSSHKRKFRDGNGDDTFHLVRSAKKRRFSNRKFNPAQLKSKLDHMVRIENAFVKAEKKEASALKILKKARAEKNKKSAKAAAAKQEVQQRYVIWEELHRNVSADQQRLRAVLGEIALLVKEQAMLENRIATTRDKANRMDLQSTVLPQAIQEEDQASVFCSQAEEAYDKAKALCETVRTLYTASSESWLGTRPADIFAELGLPYGDYDSLRNATNREGLYELMRALKLKGVSKAQEFRLRKGTVPEMMKCICTAVDIEIPNQQEESAFAILEDTDDLCEEIEQIMTVEQKNHSDALDCDALYDDDADSCGADSCGDE